MTRLTIDNVEAPDFTSSFKMFDKANKSFETGLDAASSLVKGVVDDRQKAVDSEFLSQFISIKTEDEFNKALNTGLLSNFANLSDEAKKAAMGGRNDILALEKSRADIAGTEAETLYRGAETGRSKALTQSEVNNRRLTDAQATNELVNAASTRNNIMLANSGEKRTQTLFDQTQGDRNQIIEVGNIINESVNNSKTDDEGINKAVGALRAQGVSDNIINSALTRIQDTNKILPESEGAIPESIARAISLAERGIDLAKNTNPIVNFQNIGENFEDVSIFESIDKFAKFNGITFKNNEERAKFTKRIKQSSDNYKTPVPELLGAYQSIMGTESYSFLVPLQENDPFTNRHFDELLKNTYTNENRKQAEFDKLNYSEAKGRLEEAQKNLKEIQKEALTRTQRGQKVSPELQEDYDKQVREIQTIVDRFPIINS